jgi:hypothetical protein
MADIYAIIGFSYALDGPVVLYESDSCTACDEWRKGYTRWGEWGGYDMLALYEIGPNQTALTIPWRDLPIITWDREEA